ncbi:MAG TPA: cytochrome c maturation protein CcmE [Acidimicrobiia bacterium]|nr:cytochrome c maturation protein CcmE [Acidimicrobiia bacterium]
MAHRRFVLLGIAGVIALVVGLTVTSLGENLTYYLYPTEAVAQKGDFPDGERFRLAGTVVAGSMVETENQVAFDLTDGGATVAVILTESAPDLLAEEVPVLLEGAWSGDEFVANEVLIRHDENYEVPEEGGAYPAG